MNYSRIAKSRRRKQIITSLLSLTLVSSIIALVFVFSTTNVNTESVATKENTISSSKELKTASSVSSSTEPSTAVIESTTSPETTEMSVDAVTVVESSPVVEEEQAYTTYASTDNYSYVEANTPVTTSYTPTSQVNTTLSNGNTAGQIGSEAAAQMAVATGVPQSTWEHIIARESNGNPNVSNASGASGLFQTMPGWGSTATVQDQVNSAINAYKAQGLSAWGY